MADLLLCACPVTAKRERLLARGWTPEQIRQRLATRWPVEQKIARADFVIWTEGAPDTCALQIDRIVAKL